MVTILSGQTIQVVQKEKEFVSYIEKYQMFILSTHQDLMNVCFMKSLYKIVKSLLVLYTALQTNVIFIFFASHYT